MTAKFTALTLNLTGSKTLRILGSTERLHAIIELSLGPTDGRNPNGNRPLWRLDGNKLIIISDGTPEERILRDKLDVEEYSTSPYLLPNKVERDQRWMFRLKANATKRLRVQETEEWRRENPGKHHVGAVVPIIRQPALIDWLDEQGKKAGFHITRDRLDRPEATTRQKRDTFRKKSGNIVTLTATTFDGFLSVDDPIKFKRALLTGIGRSKAYGNGLISIAPVMPKEA